MALDRPQAHYLTAVLRLKSETASWSSMAATANGTPASKQKACSRPAGRRADPAQTEAADLHYLFAPLKAARLDYMVQKAVEMGASRLQPVLTRHGQVARVNASRMRANAIEAAEQCGILVLPEIAEPVPLTRLLAEHDPARCLVFCDEDAEVANPVAALEAVRPRRPLRSWSVRRADLPRTSARLLLKLPNVVRLCARPANLRADTAAVAALALVQAVLGDWR